MSSSLEGPQLASLLRECATYIERNEPSPLLYKALEALHHYTEQIHKPNPTTTGSAPHNSTTTQQQPQQPQQAPPNATLSKPAFQRPTNPKSNLIANGWMEQQRRSKLRIVWKTVLCSLVEGRRPGEETTLWIQRQVPLTPAGGGLLDTGSTPANGTAGTGGSGDTKMKLEALHQIPMKWLEAVKFVDYYGDFRLTLKVYNVSDDFVFRLPQEIHVREWLATLNSAREASQQGGGAGSSDYAFPDLLSSNTSVQSHTNEKSQGGGLFPDLLDESNTTTGANPSSTPTSQGTPTSSTNTSTHNTGSNPTNNSNDTKERMSIKELRAIAHGAGYKTRGMERSDLEKIAEHYAPISSKIPTPVYTAPPANGTSTTTAHVTGSAPATTTPAATSTRQDPPDWNDLEAEEKRVKEQREYIKLKRAQEVKRKEQEVREKIQREANAARQARQSAQSQQQKQQQQPRPQQQQPQRPMWNGANGTSGGGGIPSPRRATRRPFDQNQFESNRFFGNTPSASTSRPTPPSSPKHSQQQQQQHQQQSYSRPQQAPRPTPSAPPPPPPMGDPTSPISHKYAKAMKSEDKEQAAQTTIKRNILLTWALVPPTYNMLKPIDQLLTSIHIAFPPAFGVASHAYFSKWKTIPPSDLILNASTMGNAPDESKLKKGVRKLRVFLHPDKLPRDLNPQQTFVCKMLWDVTNDAWEEFMKQKEQLDWVHN